MANRTKSGLDYFPLDVDFFQDLRQKKDKSVDEFIKWRELN